jgi:hypothetical protein
MIYVFNFLGPRLFKCNTYLLTPWSSTTNSLIFLYYLPTGSISSFSALVNHAINLPTTSILGLTVLFYLLAEFKKLSWLVLLDPYRSHAPNASNILYLVRGGWGVPLAQFLLSSHYPNPSSSYWSIHQISSSRDSSVGVATGWTTRVQFPAGQHFSLLHNIQIGSGAHPAS